VLIKTAAFQFLGKTKWLLQISKTEIDCICYLAAIGCVLRSLLVYKNIYSENIEVCLFIRNNWIARLNH